MKAPINFKQIFQYLALILLTICFSACVKQKEAVPMDLAQQHIIPKPASLVAEGSSFEISANTEIQYQNSELESLANVLANLLRPATGFDLLVKEMTSKPSTSSIYLSLSDSISGSEGYSLKISEKGLQITGNKAAGVFYGIQTLRQLLPSSLELGQQISDTLRIATGLIQDKPAYGYRGAMLDVARHFFTVDEVKRYIDYMALYKMNNLHLHLSDDQGWRIEIKSWPNLTTHGGSTEVGGGDGGFYTQEQFKDIIAYAQERFITIIPEIDMPGHTNAALASYPELNCNGKATKLYTGTKVGFSTLCTDKEITYTFVDDVVREISAMIPGDYFHIGGDESHVTPIKKYIPFINRVQEIVKKYNKKVLGWDEIAHANLDATSVVHFWDKGENALRGIKQGAKVLMSPAKKAYLDMKYDSLTKTGLNWAAFIEVKDSYDWNLEEYTEGLTRANIIGVEAPLWGETVTNLDEIEYLAFPRLLSIAEIGWTERENRNWDEYKLRLAKQNSRFKALGIDYYPSAQVPWEN